MKMVSPSSSSAADQRRLEAVVPHRFPMLLLDGLVDHDGEQVCCRVDLRDESPFVETGRLPALVCLEYMAQAVAVFAGLSRGEARVGYLVGVRELDLEVDGLSVGDTLLVTVKHVWSNEISGSFEGWVECAGRRVAFAKLSVFVPPTDEDAP